MFDIKRFTICHAKAEHDPKVFEVPVPDYLIHRHGRELAKQVLASARENISIHEGLPATVGDGGSQTTLVEATSKSEMKGVAALARKAADIARPATPVAPSASALAIHTEWEASEDELSMPLWYPSSPVVYHAGLDQYFFSVEEARAAANGPGPSTHNPSTADEDLYARLMVNARLCVEWRDGAAPHFDAWRQDMETKVETEPEFEPVVVPIFLPRPSGSSGQVPALRGPGDQSNAGSFDREEDVIWMTRTTRCRGTRRINVPRVHTSAARCTGVEPCMATPVDAAHVLN